MDSLERYRRLIQDLLAEYAQPYLDCNPTNHYLICDRQQGHYQWMEVGWDASKRLYRSIIHFDIQNAKIWLQQNLTDQDPAAALVAQGVPQEDIILGFQSPFKRPYTGYGIS
jgi:hypothetical protein